jgi:hypothetical protein
VVTVPRASSEVIAQATDQVVGLYRAGASMQAIVDQTRIGRTTIRKILLAEGVPRRPTGHPRLLVSSEAVAALYESGLTMAETADRLNINRSAAWVRYLEIRDRRGVTPGRWHQVLLDALEGSPAVLVIATVTVVVGRELTRAEAAAVRRAARELARVGVADLGHVTVTWNGHSAAYLSLARPGVDANDPSQLRLYRS